MNRKSANVIFQRLIVVLLIIVMIRGLDAQSNEVAVPQNWLAELSTYQSSLLLEDVVGLEKLRGLLSRWDSLGASRKEQIDFTYNVLKARVVDGWSYRLIKKKAEEYQSGVITDTFTENDLRILETHPNLLDLIFLGVLEWEYPFVIEEEAPFFKELNAYGINGTEKIGEIGAGNGVVSLLIKLFYPGVELYINELDRAFVKYIIIKLNSGIGRLEDQQVSILKGSRRSTNLEGAELDKIIIRNTFHHFKDQTDMLSSIALSLRPGGELFVWESIREFDTDGDGCEYALSREEIKTAFVNSSFELLEEIDFSEAVLFKLRKK